MTSLGIFLGPRLISVVETKGRKIINQLKITRSLITASEAEEKVAEELKLVALFKDEFRKNKITANQATLALSGRDLIVRTFEMPILPHEELKNAVSFEAKKYTPFRIEELTSNYQVELDKTNRRNLVLFLGIKKEVLGRYLSAFNQLNIKVNAIEHSAFSVLRLAKLVGVANRGVVAVVSVDTKEDDETNFTVLENGFPLFSRDITLGGLSSESVSGESEKTGAVIEKLKAELRVSLDFYNRKFARKNIERIFFIAGDECRAALDTFAIETNVPVQLLDVTKCTGRPVPFSLGFIKSYCASLSPAVKTKLKINLLPQVTTAQRRSDLAQSVTSLFLGIRIIPGLLFGAAICIATFAWGMYQMYPLKEELKSIIAMRPQVATASGDLSYEELENINTQYKRKISRLDNLIKKQLFLTGVLDIFPRTIPTGVWLNNFSFNKIEEGKVEVTLEGLSYLADGGQEFEMVNKFISNLKDNPEFSKYFKEINIVSLERKDIGNVTGTFFKIQCKTF